MVAINSVVYNHPLAQAQFAIGLLNTYRITSDPKYLDLAKVQAQRLIDRSITSRGAIYFPYPFSFARHGVIADSMIPPWYSGMAQGEALAVFSILWQATADPIYRDAATRTYNSFVNPRASGVPWTVFVDGSGYLWFEEYPKDPPDMTFNGHMYAIFGLYEYYRYSRSPGAFHLIRGGLSTVHHYFSSFRNPAWISRYCLAHGVLSPTYHQVHGGQLYVLYRLTGAVEFARDADVLRVDYPDYRVAGTVTFSGGSHTGYRFDSAGRTTGSKTSSLSRSSIAPTSSRRRIISRSGSWFLITAGVWAGYWIQEAPGHAFIRGMVMTVNYDPLRTASFAAGTYTGYRYDAGGLQTASRRVTLSHASSAHADRLAIVNGTMMLEIVDGIWAGYWIPLGSGLSD